MPIEEQAMDGFAQQSSAILQALLERDSWMLAEALRQPAAYGLAAIAMLVAVPALLLLFRAVPWIDRNIERYALVATYLTIATVIF
ncbi:MAG TPA: TRAP transporter small permease, partial [Rhodospirillales bacterium]|nr:TRAP transporter small permease [Rhodospirillales bacterium]